MAVLKACALRSGSSGNAIYIGSGQTRILVDAGVCCRTIEESLFSIGESASSLDGLLITHEHSDHIAGAGALLRRYKIPVFVSRATWQAMKNIAGPVDDSLVRLIEPGRSAVIGDLSVTSFKTPHDAADSAGFRIDGKTGSVAVMTDAGHIEESALQAISGCQAIFIEANYDPAMLLAGVYPEMLKQRIFGKHGHLSNDDCAEAVCHLLEKGTSRFILSHISKDNNYPELALMTVCGRLHEIGAREGSDCQIMAAQRFTVSEPVCF